MTLPARGHLPASPFITAAFERSVLERVLRIADESAATDAVANLFVDKDPGEVTPEMVTDALSSQGVQGDALEPVLRRVFARAATAFLADGDQLSDAEVTYLERLRDALCLDPGRCQAALVAVRRKANLVSDRDLLERYADVTRQLVQEENHRINERMTWLVQLEGLLFAAVGFVWGKPDDQRIVIALAVLGIFSTAAIFTSLWWAVKAMDDIERDWRDGFGQYYCGPRVIGKGWTTVAGPDDARKMKRQRMFLLHPPFAVPSVSFVAWCAVLIIRIGFPYTLVP
jgi:hypothetical protein